MTTESTAARIVRELTARPMTRRELAALLGLSAGAISLQTAKLQAMRVIDVAGNVRSPSGVGVVLAFRAFLAARRILYQIGGTWTPYAEHLDAGRFVVKVGNADNGHAFSTARFTPKGVAWVTGLWSEAIGRNA